MGKVGMGMGKVGIGMGEVDRGGDGVRVMRRGWGMGWNAERLSVRVFSVS